MSQTKWLISCVFGVVVCIAIAAYVLREEQQGGSAGNSIDGAAVSVDPKAELSDSTIEAKSEFVPEPVVADVNEQIDSFK